MIISKLEMWGMVFWAVGHAAARTQSAPVIALPVVHRDHEFVEPKKGPRKFCEACGRTALLHKRRVVYCSSCGQDFEGLAEGFAMCSEHRHIPTPVLEVNR